MFCNFKTQIVLDKLTYTCVDYVLLDIVIATAYIAVMLTLNVLTI